MYEERPRRGRSVIVTGAADGVGYGLARHFTALGDRVAMVDIGADRLERAAQRLRDAGADVVPIVADVADEEAVDAAVDEVVQRYGRIDVLLSNVGILTSAPVIEMPVEEWDRVLAVNLRGTFLMTRAAGRVMVEQGDGGRIVCTTSAAARSGRRGAAHYCASKAGLEQFVRVLCMELAPHGITVNMVSPGYIDHGDRPGIGRMNTQEYTDAIAKTLPLGRVGTVDDVTPAVEYLCSAGAQYVTGTLISADGGGTAGRFHLPLTGRTNGIPYTPAT